MRVAFIGKGGSGKTTMSSSYIRWRARDRFVVAVDADVNKHLADALSMENKGRDLIPLVKDVFEFLEPHRAEFVNALGERPMIGCLPVASSSTRITCSPRDPFIKKFAVTEGNISLFTAGTYAEADIGKSCYHAKLFGTQLIAHRISDKKDDTVVFDVTAGTDPVATSLILAYDLHVVVVEPTSKSVSVFNDYMIATAAVRRGPVMAIANKLRGAQDLEFIKSHIPAEVIIGSSHYSSAVRQADQGDPNGMEKFIAANEELFKSIDAVLRSLPPRDEEYFSALTRWFKAYCARWYDALYGTALGEISEVSRSAVSITEPVATNALGERKNSAEVRSENLEN